MTQRIRNAVVCLFVTTGPVFGQTDKREIMFDVASVKVSAPMIPGKSIRVGMSGGPGMPDPIRFACQNCSLFLLLTAAYGLGNYQLSGPSSLSEMFDISATVPKGATREEVKVMLQNLLSERFSLKFHNDKKEMQVYALEIAKGGPRLISSSTVTRDEQLPAPVSGANLDKDGYPILPLNHGTATINGRSRMRLQGGSMEDFAAELSGQLNRPVLNATGLKGKYDISLFWASESLNAEPDIPLAAGPDRSPAPSLAEALQQQIGLRLRQTRGLVNAMVVDHIEKLPTEN